MLDKYGNICEYDGYKIPKQIEDTPERNRLHQEAVAEGKKIVQGLKQYIAHQKVLGDFYKENDDDLIWWANELTKDKDGSWEVVRGSHLFSFDKQKVFNLFRDYPHELTMEQKEIFDRENPFWANFFSNNGDDPQCE